MGFCFPVSGAFDGEVDQDAEDDRGNQVDGEIQVVASYEIHACDERFDDAEDVVEAGAE